MRQRGKPASESSPKGSESVHKNYNIRKDVSNQREALKSAIKFKSEGALVQRGECKASCVVAI